MSEKRKINHPDKEVVTGAYSAGIKIDGWLYVSGQGPLDLKSGEVISGSIEDETKLTMQHVKKILQAAGYTLDNVVKCTCHLADINDFDRFNKTYSDFFSGTLPARTTIQSTLWGGIKVEIDAIAYKKQI